MLPASQAKWPIGIREAKDYQTILLVEGAPDLLAAFEAVKGHSDKFAPVAMLSAACPIHTDARRLFDNKRVRIFAHNDGGTGQRAAVGFAYVYLIYGIHHCLNVVTERAGNGAAVLIRALEPVKNLEGKTNGPGLLCRAMEIDRRLNAHDLLSDDFFIAQPEVAKKFSIVKRPRIGVDYAKHWAKRRLRFYIKGNPFISRP